MTYLAISLVVAWICGLIVLTLQSLNDIRLILNNLIPNARPTADQPSQAQLMREAATSLPFGAQGLALGISTLLIGRLFNLDHWKGFRITKIDPALVNETGLVYLKRAIYRERIFSIWIIAGLIIVGWTSYYLFAS